MSHVTRIQTKLSDRAELKAALEELGYTVWEDQPVCFVERGAKQTQCCDLVIPAVPPSPHLIRLSSQKPGRTTPKPNPQVELICFLKVGSTYEVFTDWDDVGLTKDEFVSLVTQRYSYRMTRRKLEEQGFLATSQEDRDGAICLVLSRDQEQVEAHIGREGDITLTARGFQAQECFAATRELEQALGDDIKERDWTVEAYFGPIPAVPVPAREYAYATLIPEAKTHRAQAAARLEPEELHVRER